MSATPQATGGDRALANEIAQLIWVNAGVEIGEVMTVHIEERIAAHREQAVTSALAAQSAELEALKATVERLSGHLGMLMAKGEGRVQDENNTVEAKAYTELTALRDGRK